MRHGSSTSAHERPTAQGLYDPRFEHDACGVGFVAHIGGVRSHEIVRDALTLLERLAHRSAVGADPETGDGAGILLQLPHAFLRRQAHAAGMRLPDAGAYGVGMCFLPRDEAALARCLDIIERIVAQEGWQLLGWREVATDATRIGVQARDTAPVIRQCVVAPRGIASEIGDAAAFERRLYLMRRRIELAVVAASLPNSDFHLPSFSSRTIVYKGMLRPHQLRAFYPELGDADVASALAVVHSRFSTNTFPSWPLAQPFRHLCHNGEINTVRGNVHWMGIRESAMESSAFGGRTRELLPLIAEGQSDSACLDNALELLVAAGRPIEHALTMLVPAAWESDASLTPERRAFHEFHATMLEPWDGPAALVFTDGRVIGASLDRNGLRPARYVVTTDDRVILASEAGALALPPDRIRAKGHLRAGRMLLVNTVQGRLLDDDAVKSELAGRRTYRRWLDERRVQLATQDGNIAVAPSIEALAPLHRAFGYTAEELRMVLAPMATTGEEPVGSMGNDAPLAVLSERPQLLFSYFRQLFAQVTNPAIDPIREQLVMSLATLLGPQGNLLDEAPEHASRLHLDAPVLDAADFEALQHAGHERLGVATLPSHFAVASGADGFADVLDALCRTGEALAASGCGLLVISDRGVDEAHAALPSLLAASALHQHLVRTGLRGRVGIVVETAEARDVSQIAQLMAYGAGAVYPYLALDTVASLADAALLGDTTAQAARSRYGKALHKGLLKILSKLGISTLQSYCGSRSFEAVGLDRALVARHFTGTVSRLGGIGLEAIAHDVLVRHAAAYDPRAEGLEEGSTHHYRNPGEQHQWNPLTIAALQRAVREERLADYAEFSDRVAAEGARTTLRGLLGFVAGEPVPLDDVEPATAIARRFVTGAMSFGSLSAEAHETLAVAMNALGGRSNTGEGGEDPARFGTPRNSAIKQVASARFGVTTEYLVNATELQIKIAQGAKPGEGGQLPGHKVDDVIARTRHATPGVTLISPPPHHDIYSIEDLAQLIHDLRCVNPTAEVSVKLVAEAGVGTVAAGVAKAGADRVVVSGDSGGTGASPLSSIKHAGVPWEMGLAEAQQTLLLSGLRDRVRLQTDGQLKTGRDVVVAALLGADEFGFATAPLVAQGCVMMRKCHLNTCPVGIATQDPVLRARFTGLPEHVIRYFLFVADEVRATMARLGFRTMDEMIGRAEVLRPAVPEDHRTARTLDLAPLLHVPRSAGARHFVAAPTRETESAVDRTIVSRLDALTDGPIAVASLVRSTDRAVGAFVSGALARRQGAADLPDGSVRVALTGSAGQSFGAFGARGLTLDLEGEANDYVGKGLSGARLVVRPPRGVTFIPDQTIIVGNTALYGATSGEAFIAGVAGQRFAVRNSGATAVVEGVGDHGCEYMTGGTVIVLGRTGRNFAAGMSGGLAFVLDESGEFADRCNPGMVELSPITGAASRTLVRRLVERHATLTHSPRARHLLHHWEQLARRFVAVVPTEYRRALEAHTERELARAHMQRQVRRHG